MSFALTLASASKIRATLLENAGLSFEIMVPRVDEESVKESLLLEDTAPRDVADALAQLKATNIARNRASFVIGADQVLDFDGQLLSKPKDKDELISALKNMRGKRHQLHSAAVIIEDGKPVWRHVGTVRLHMRNVSDEYVAGYVERNWDEIRHCVGGYMLEAEGARLFRRIEGDYFHVLGLPLLEILDYLTLRGVIDG